MKEFRELGISKELISVLEELRFQAPSEIQKRTIPLILEGKDVIGNAATGSGKTFAFASGVLNKAVPGKGVQALVLTPTRELAEQITKVTRNFAKNTPLKITEIYGGVDMGRQVQEIKTSEIIIGTPGRILDHLERKTLDLFELKILVLDEADRMVDMGFLPDVEKIIRQCPIKRQTLLFSATSSPDIQYIEKKYMVSPVSVTVETHVDPTKLVQHFYDSPGNMKFSLLVHFLKKEKSGTVMIFCNTRKNVDLLAMNLIRHGLRSQAIHGGLAQNKRSRIMERFHNKESNILICTDVAARGLDIKGVTHVYNYDLPQRPEDYIHRIGRTARAGKSGLAISIVSPRDYDNFRRITQDSEIKVERKELPEIEQLEANFGDRGYGRDRRSSGGDRRGSYRRNDGRNHREERRQTFRRPSRRDGGFRRSSRGEGSRGSSRRNNNSRRGPRRY